MIIYRLKAKSREHGGWLQQWRGHSAPFPTIQSCSRRLDLCRIPEPGTSSRFEEKNSKQYLISVGTTESFFLVLCKFNSTSNHNLLVQESSSESYQPPGKTLVCSNDNSGMNSNDISNISNDIYIKELVNMDLCLGSRRLGLGFGSSPPVVHTLVDGKNISVLERTRVLFQPRPPATSKPCLKCRRKKNYGLEPALRWKR